MVEKSSEPDIEMYVLCKAVSSKALGDVESTNYVLPSESSIHASRWNSPCAWPDGIAIDVGDTVTEMKFAENCQMEIST